MAPHRRARPPPPRLAPHLELVQLQQIAVHDGRGADGAQQPPLLGPALREHAVSALEKQDVGKGQEKPREEMPAGQGTGQGLT